MADEILRLELELKEVDVVLVDKEDNEKKYLLKELSGSDRNRYLNKMKNRVTTDKNGNVKINTFDGMQSDLLTVSLFNEAGESVSKDEIEMLPSNTQQKLFEKAQELSGLNSEASEKN